MTWSISPTNAGTIDSSGNYTAPASITTQQTVTVTATSQADSTKSATAAVILSAPCAWTGYHYERLVVIDHTKVSNTDQLDFPILVSGTFPFLANISHSGTVYNPNGYDIVFTSDAAGLNRLDFEIDNYDPMTGVAAFWIRIPVLSHSSDTTIYMWYSNASIATSQENIGGVWKNNYLSVYHLGNETALSMTDSGGAGYTLTGTAEAVPGRIGGAAAFNGTSNTYLIHDSVPAYPSGDSAVTLEAWVRRAPQFGSTTDFVGYGENSRAGSRVALGSASSSDISLEFENEGIDASILADPDWHHIVGVYGGGAIASTADQLYIDGVPASTSTTSGTPSITTTEFKIGGVPDYVDCCELDGSVDEVRVSSGIRTARLGSDGVITTRVRPERSTALNPKRRCW